MEADVPCGVGRELMGASGDWVELCDRQPAHVLVIRHENACEEGTMCEHPLYLCCHHFHQLPEEAMEPEFDPSMN